jgi:probable HAF family extracellular repeat protein
MKSRFLMCFHSDDVIRCSGDACRARRTGQTRPEQLGYASGAFAVSNRGQVVGFATNTIPDPSSFCYPGLSKRNQTRALRWQKGVRRTSKQCVANQSSRKGTPT